MAGFREIEGLRGFYFGSGSKILHEFLLPVLAEAVTYDRISSYFTLDALIAMSWGLDALYARGGRVRLAAGIHDFPKDVARATPRTCAPPRG